MTAPPRCGLATDLDGTLLRPDLTVSEATRAGLAEAAGRGVLVAFVTGRPPRWMAPVVATTGHVGVAVCANGSVIVDLTRDEILETSVIPEAIALEVRARLRRILGSEARFGIEYASPGPMSESGFVHEPGFTPRVLAGARVQDLDTGPPAVKILARLPGFGRHLGDPNDHNTDFHRRAAAVVEQVNAELSDLVTVTHTSRTDLLLEMGPLGVSKATGLAAITSAGSLGASEVSAVGDMPNDIPMLEWAGESYAVASAHPSVQRVADHILPDPEQDGVLQLLERL